MVSRYNFHYYTGGGDFMGKRNVGGKDKKGHPTSTREYLPESRRVKTLWVANLAREMTEYKLITMFKPFGEIERTQYAWHTGGERKGDPKGYAFIEYKTKEEADRALLEMNGKEAFGKPLVVNIMADESEQQNVNISRISSSLDQFRQDSFHNAFQSSDPSSSSRSSVAFSSAFDFGVGSSSLSTEDRIATIEAQLKTLNSELNTEDDNESDDDETLGFKPYKSLHEIKREVEQAELQKKMALESLKTALTQDGKSSIVGQNTQPCASLTSNANDSDKTKAYDRKDHRDRDRDRDHDRESWRDRGRGRDDHERARGYDRDRDRDRERNDRNRDYDREKTRSDKYDRTRDEHDRYEDKDRYDRRERDRKHDDRYDNRYDDKRDRKRDDRYDDKRDRKRDDRYTSSNRDR